MGTVRSVRASEITRTWITLSVLAAALFFKSVYYRQVTGMDALNAGQLLTAYLSVAAAAVGLAMVAWFPRRWPAITLLVVTDLWFVAGIWYYKANHLWLNWSAARTVTELQGFESSVLAYMEWSQLLLPLTTLIAIGLLSVLPSVRVGKRQIGMVCAMVAVLYAASVLGRRLWPLSELEQQTSMKAEEHYFLKTHSPLMQAGWIICEAVQEGMLQWKATRPFSAREQTIMDTVWRHEQPQTTPQGHLVFILVESLETWALEATDIEGRKIGSSLLSYVTSHPVLYVPEVETQQKYGRSGDGQLITQTGLLPLSSGVACRQYGENVYPNLAHFYEDGAVFNPYHIPVWNQKVVTYSYGFKHLKNPRMLFNQSDKEVLHRAIQYLTDASEPTMALVLTIDTHTPFRSHRDSVKLTEDYTVTEKDYLCSVHYTDRHIGHFLAWADTAACMRQATIVITADHNHFPRENDRGLCPLIIRSPQITESVTLPSALQMDIFPTVLYAIDQANYAWQGFGVNLLDPHAEYLLNHRSVSAKEAYLLSDKLIRSNFFAQ